MTATTQMPFDVEHVTNPDHFHQAAGSQLLKLIGLQMIFCMGAFTDEMEPIPGRFGRGGIYFIGELIPFISEDVRGEEVAAVAVMVSVTPLDEIDVEVREIHSGKEHAKIEGIYIDQLARVLLGLDYDGKELLNPAYW